ncbi:D-apiose dehydrogenase [Burkholderiales bacterium]|nr:MAG: Gfo/Idh/MocA family oxidoreductase [Burkholderiales bacterium]CAG0963031.1 D-apiose dehydrogenase [Burkholderiales bacterium]
MNPRLKVAGVGAGYFSQFHYLAWSRNPEVDLVAIADCAQEKASVMAQRFGLSRSYASLEAMLDHEQPDLLDIITPPSTHRELVTLALQRGIAVICQKPFGRDYQEAEDLANQAERAARPLVVHENFRWQPWYREARRLIDAGTLGQLHAVAFRLRPGDGQGGAAYLDRQPYFQAMPRLLVQETAIHWIDTFRFLMGEVVAVYARLRRLNPVLAGEDAGYLLFEFESGASGLFDGNRLNEHPASDLRRTMGEMWLEGSRGVLRLDGEGSLWWKSHRGVEQEHAFDRGLEDTFGGGACGWLQAHVVAHLRHGAPLENSARAYLANLKVQEAVYRSHVDGLRVELKGFDPKANPVRSIFSSY